MPMLLQEIALVKTNAIKLLLGMLVCQIRKIIRFLWATLLNQEF